MMALIGRAIGNKYVIVGVLAASILAWGAWQKHKAIEAKTKIEGLTKSLNLAQSELDNSVSVADHNKAVADARNAEAARQAGIVAEANKKARDRLAENNKLRKAIANATDNPPIPDALERVLDAYRVRSAVPGTTGEDSDNEAGDGAASGEPGPVVSDPASPTS